MRKFTKILALMALLLTPAFAIGQSTLTVADGTSTNGYVPIYGYWADAYLRCQTIYPAGTIASGVTTTDMTGGTITALTFYSSNNVTYSGTFVVKMTEVTATTLNGWADVSSATTVYTGPMTIGSGVMQITLDNSYTYNGGNLLIEVGQTSTSTYSSCSFYGVSASGASWQGYNSSSFSNITGSAQNFMPKVTFTFTGGSTVSCFGVQGHSVSDIDSNAATIHWVDTANSGASYTVYYWKNGTTDTLTTTASVDSVVLSGLDANCVYNYYIVVNCSATDESLPSATGQFRTACGEIVLPYFVDFEDAAYNGAWYPCWDSTLHYNTDPSVNNVFHHSGTYGMYLSANGYNMVVSPAVPLPGDEIFVNFWVYLENSTTSWLKAGVMTNPHDTSTFIPLVNITEHDFNYNFREYNFTTATLDPTATYHVAFLFYGTSTYSGRGGLDDITIRQDNGCNKPAMAVVDSVAPYSAYLSWTSGGNSATSYDVFYNTTNNLATADVVSVSTTGDTISYELTGLLPQTHYYAWVRTACGSDSADVKAFPSFTTQMTCAPLTGVTMGNISYTAAQVTWDYDTTQGFPSNGVYITIVDNTDTTVAPATVEVTGTSYTFSDLAAGHSYTATLRNMCDAPSQTDTAAANTVTFMTASCAEISSDGTTYNYIPTYTYYNYSYTQAIYTASMMPNVDTIRGIAFNLTSTQNTTRTFDVYMTHTTESSFANSSSWITVDNTMKVATAKPVNCNAAGWVVIPFDNNFVYNGTGNVLIAIDDNTGSYTTAPYWASINASNQGLYIYNDYTDYDPLTYSSSGNLANKIPAVRFVADCEVPECFAPMLSVEAVDSVSISISWVSTGTESSWAVGIKPNGTANYTFEANAVADTFFTFTGLNANTAYDIIVGSLCMGDTISATMTTRTACGALSLPLTTGFEADNIDDVPACWTAVHSYTYNRYDYSTYQYVDVDYPAVSDGSHTGSNSLAFRGSNNLIATQAIPVPGDQISVTFWAKFYNYSNMTFEAGVMSDLTVDSTFIPLVTVNPPSDGTIDYTRYEFTTSGLDATQTYHVAFRHNCSSASYYAAVDDINIRLDDGCHRSSDLVLLDADTNYVTLSWSNDGTVNTYAVQYRHADSAGWVNLPTAYDTTTYIFNLVAGNTYYTRVGTICSDDTLWTDPLMFRTACTPMILPYTNSFESDAEGVMPACWGNTGATGYYSYYNENYPAVYSDNPHTGDNALRFYYINGTAYAFSDVVPLPGDSIYVSFWADVYTSSGTVTLEAGVMTNPYVDSTFIPLETATTGGYSRYEFNTNTLDATANYRIAFRYTSSYNYNRADIDDINIRLDEGCMYPTNVVATPSTNSIALTWRNNASTANFAIAHMQTGDSVWTLDGTTTDTAYTITALDAATSYEVRVGFICTNDTLWSYITAVTNCGALSLPYFENFDAYPVDVLPPCWSFADPDGVTHWDGGLFFRASGSAPYGHLAGIANYAVVPELAGNFSKLQITFCTKVGTMAENDGIVIGAADAAGNLLAWIDTIQDVNFSRNNHVYKTINFLNYGIPAGASRIAFAQLRSWGEWALIDNINITELPDCYPIDSLTVHNIIDPDHTNFTWSAMGNETEWQVYVDTVTAIIDSLPDSLFTTVTTTSYTIPVGAIQGGGIYKFYVRANCGYEQSTWTSYEFGAGTVIMNNSATADTVVGCGMVVYDNGGPIAGYLGNSNSALVLRSENVGSQLEIFGGKFGFGQSPATLTVYDGEGTNGDVLYTYNLIGTDEDIYDSILATSTTGALTITFTVSGEMCHKGYELYVHCVGTALCARPTHLNVEMTEIGEATATWDGTASLYDVYYKPTGATTWTMDTVSSNSIVLTGLIADTTYDIYVVADCDTNGYSTPSFTVTFSSHFNIVIVPCDEVSDLAYSNVTTNSAMLNWVSDGNEWEIEVTRIGGIDTVVATTNPYNMTGLLPNMTYSVRMRTVCTGDRVEPYSGWSNIVEFTTENPNPGAIDGVDAGAELRIFPNPASTSVTLSFEGINGQATVEIVDISGRIVSSVMTANNQITLDVSQLAQGAYFVRVTGDEATAVRRLIVR